MSNPTPTIRIGIFGANDSPAAPERGWRLWPVGYHGSVTAAGAEPVLLKAPARHQTWDNILHNVQGVVLAGGDMDGPARADAAEALCLWCRAHRLPLLAIDSGLLTLNSILGGSLYLDLPREMPEALQHRHPPEPGLRHVINVSPGTRLSAIYGEGEIVVNSAHRRAVQRLARGFKVSARALDGVIEAVEAEAENWYAIGVQWQPASASASGLDIQVFRGLIGACHVPARACRKARRVLAKVA